MGLLRALVAGGLCVAAVAASGAWRRAAAAHEPADWLVVPGESVGKIRLGMPRAEVLALLGTPREARADLLVYRARRGGNRLQVYFAEGRAVQIDFTSASFRTREGISVRNYADAHAARFAKWMLRWRFVNLRYTLRSGGLTFYGLNVDSAHPDYASVHVGVVHRGAAPPHPALALDGEPDGGWTPWDGGDLYPQPATPPAGAAR